MEKVEILRITLYLVVPRWIFFKDEILIHYFSNITDEFILLVNSMIKVVHLLTSFKVKILLQQCNTNNNFAIPWVPRSRDWKITGNYDQCWCLLRINHDVEITKSWTLLVGHTVERIDELVQATAEQNSTRLSRAVASLDKFRIN